MLTHEVEAGLTGGRAVVAQELFERYAGRVYAFARRLVDAATAEDVVQEVFVRLLGRVDLAEREISVGYLLKAAENVVRQRYHRDRRAGEVAGRCAGERGEERDAEDVIRAFAALSPNEREALRLVVCEGLSYKAAAAAMDVSVTTLNNWKFRALQKLREEASGSGRARAG